MERYFAYSITAETANAIKLGNILFTSRLPEKIK